MASVNKISPTWTKEVRDSAWGSFGNAVFIDDPELPTSGQDDFVTIIKKYASGGPPGTKSYYYTEYPLIFYYTNGGVLYNGGVLGYNGDVHFVPAGAEVGQKYNYISGRVTTYALLITSSNFSGGVLTPNGEIHFIPQFTNIVQRVTPSAGDSVVVSTYSLPPSPLSFVSGGAAILPDGNIHFCAGGGSSRNYNYKVDYRTLTGSTYPVLVSRNYTGCVLAPNGDLHMVPDDPILKVGQYVRASPNGSVVVGTYSLPPGPRHSYGGAAISPDGHIHFVQLSGDPPVGLKVNWKTLVATTYSAIDDFSYYGMFTGPDGLPTSIDRGSATDVYKVENGTTSLAQALSVNYPYGNGGWQGQVLCPDNSVVLVPRTSTAGAKVYIPTAMSFPQGVLSSPYFTTPNHV